MPAAYIHEKIAKKAISNIKNLPESFINNFDVFEFGAQGPDLLFYHRMLHPLEKNRRPNVLGERIHMERVGEFLTTLLKYAKENNGAECAWVIGFVSHYATDSTIHPFVYSTTNNEDGTNNTTRHLVLESQFDTWYYRKEGNIGVPRQAQCIKRLTHNQKDDIAKILTHASKKVFPEYMLDYYQAYSTINDMGKIIKILYSARNKKHYLFTMLENMIFHPKIVTRYTAAHRLPKDDFLNLEKSIWYNPWDKEKNEFDYNFMELFDIATKLSEKYIKAVLAYLYDNTTIEDTMKILGNNDFNSGLAIKNAST